MRAFTKDDLSKIFDALFCDVFAGSGVVVELTIYSDQNTIADLHRLQSDFVNDFSDPNMFYVDFTDDFPNLLSLSINLRPSLNKDDKDCLIFDFISACSFITLSYPDAFVVGQFFSVYSIPVSLNASSALEAISETLKSLQNIPVIGNLAHPESNNPLHERFIEFPTGDEPGFESLNRWESDLSENRLILHLSPGETFDFNLEKVALTERLSSVDATEALYSEGRPPMPILLRASHVAVWKRDITSAAEKVGSESMMLCLTTPNYPGAGLSWPSAEYFHLLHKEPALVLEVFSRDVENLSPIAEFEKRLSDLYRGNHQWPLTKTNGSKHLESFGFIFGAK